MIRFDKVVEKQINCFDLGDKRLNERCRLSYKKIDESGSSKSFPNIFQDTYQLKAFYGMINNPKVTAEKFLEGYTQGLIEHFLVPSEQADDFLFVYQDSTFGKYHDRKKLKLGYIEKLTDNGLLIHSGILTNSNYIPLGVVHQQSIIRDKADYQKSHQRGALSFENKESFKWTKGFDWAIEFNKKVNIPIVQIMDREADIAALFNYGMARNQLFIVRARHDRLLKDSDRQKFKAFIGKQKVAFEQTRTLIDEAGKKHNVNCQIRYAKLDLNEIDHSVWVIFLKALDAPSNMKETQWFLLTNLPLHEGRDMVIRSLDAYTKRWRTTEDFHKCLKTGCQIEQRQFDTPTAIKKIITMLSLSAIRLLRMRHLSQEKPEEELNLVLSEQEIQLAEILSNQFLKPTDLKFCQPKTTLWWVLLLGRMGGHQGIKKKGPPGWQTIWKGWNYFQNILNGIIISKNFFNDNIP